MKTIAVILAAGRSERMGFSKQLADLGGLPVAVRTLLAFEQTEAIDGIVLAAREADRELIRQLCARYSIHKLLAMASGGDTRQQSAQNCLAALPPDTAWIALHDGARPLVTPTLITRVLQAAYATGAAAAAIPVKDTIKRVDADGLVLETVDRAALRQVQTPQVFSLPLYRRALEDAARRGADYTDDCQLLERIGQPVTLVEGSDTNLKITTPADLTAARALLEPIRQDASI